jgi:hypothetical protein
VVSSKAASAYKDTGISPGRAAEQLRVRYVLNGSVRRMRDCIRINAQLMDTETRGSLWAGRYDGTWDDVLKLQDRVVSEVATALALRLTPQLEQPSNASAYDAVLRGLEMESRGAPDDLSAAVREFRRAIAIDPSYGRALAELAWVYYTSVGNEARQRALGIGTLETIGLAQETFSEAM